MDAHKLHGESSMIVFRKQSQLSVGEVAEFLSRDDLVSTAKYLERTILHFAVLNDHVDCMRLR